MSITYIPPRVPSVEGFLKEDGTVPLTGVWNTGNYNIIGPSAIYTSSTAPSAPYTNMLWNDTSIATRIMIRRWSGSAWQVVYGYENSSRTITVVQDHSRVLSSGIIRNEAFNEIGLFGGIDVSVTIEIDNQTQKNFLNSQAVDAGSGKVKLPLASGHGFVAGEKVCIDGTVNYDGVFDIDSVEDGYIVIPCSYVSETIPSSAIVRCTITGSGAYFGPKYTSVIIKAKDYLTARNQTKSVVFVSAGSYANFVLRGIAIPSSVRGIKFVSPSGRGLTIMESSKVDVLHCAFDNCMSNGVEGRTHSACSVECCSFRNCQNSAISASYSATIMSKENQSFADGRYGLYADLGGTIKKISALQPTGTVANEYANTSRAGQII